ncbi:MAG: SIMPL domain-containing protein [Actinobacteria bacterium]|nr:SIMPL domain-containing protein [Actinomycetota bacterium]
MSEVMITVRGEHDARVATEEGVARLTVRAEGPERGAVVERIAAVAAPVRDDLTARKTAGAIVDWSSQRVSIWADRPWNADGTQLPLVHHASVEITAVFTDFAALSWWISDVSTRDGVQVDRVDWRLTPATSTAIEAEVAASAVRVAVDRATAYAAALGLGSVTPLEIADLGLLTRGNEQAAPPMLRAAKMSFADSTGPGIDFQPEDLTIAAAVEARFLAR